MLAPVTLRVASPAPVPWIEHPFIATTLKVSVFPPVMRILAQVPVVPMEAEAMVVRPIAVRVPGPVIGEPVIVVGVGPTISLVCKVTPAAMVILLSGAVLPTETPLKVLVPETKASVEVPVPVTSLIDPPVMDTEFKFKV